MIKERNKTSTPMQNQVEIPVSRELKEKYAHSLDMLDFKVVRAFDPVR